MRNNAGRGGDGDLQATPAATEEPVAGSSPAHARRSPRKATAGTPKEQAHAGPGGLSEYEEARRQKIAENKQMLSQLGQPVSGSVSSLVSRKH